MLPFTREALREAVRDGRVTERRHSDLPYSIYNYSPDVQYSNKWDDITINCRGLILNDNAEIVARPWKKFFNLGQVNLPIQFDDPVEVMDKADGSLGILYLAGDEYAIATRGSFESHQAIHATSIWNEKYSALVPDPRYTFLFEIIYPANRIVLDYGGMDDLMLLGAVEKETGYYLGPNEAKWLFHVPHSHWGWTGPVVEVFPYKSISEALGHMGRDKAEGYVIRSHNFMVKLKEPDYVELHKLVTNASPKTVWDKLRGGMSKDEVVSAFPDEFHDYIASMVDPLLERYNERLEEILDAYGKAENAVLARHLPLWPTRADYAREFKKSKEAKYFFLLLDGKSVREVLWGELKPRETKEAR